MKWMGIVGLLGGLTLLGGCAGSACRCDIIAAESECVQQAAPDNPLYATQLQATCNTTLSSLCDTLGGTYTFGQACPAEDLAAECTTEYVNYSQTIYYYTTGGEPFDPQDPDLEDDCDGGVLTRY